MRSTLAFSACCLITAQAAQSDQTPQYTLDEIVVTATRIRQPLINTIQHTTVITDRDIQASAAPDVITLLRQQAGIEFSQQGGLGTQSSLFMRGTESDHALILLDGIRIASASTGATALDQIMLDDIERIEIVRGNVSSVYGSDAIGGVIQIFTRQGRGKPAVKLKVGLGSFGTAKGTLAFGGESGATRFHLSASHQGQDGFSVVRSTYVPTPFVFTEKDKDEDGYRNDTLSLRVSHDLDANNEIGMTGRRSAGKVEYDGAYYNNSSQTVSAFSLYSRHQLSEHWQSRFSLAWSRDELDNYLDADDAGHVHTRNRQLDWFNEWAVNPGQSLTANISQFKQELASNNAYSRTDRDVTGIALGYSGQWGPHGLQLNARHDDYSDFGGHSTGLVGYAYSLTPRWKLLASASTAFRAPSFNDLYNAAWGGNPLLKPEQAESRELGLQYAHQGSNAKLVYFDSRIDDLIVYTWPVGNQNVDKAEIDGLEASYSSAWGPYQARASLTLQDPVNRTTGEALLRRAKRHGSLALTRAWEELQLGLEILASSGRDDIHVADFSRVWVPGFTVWNLTGRYALSKEANLSLRLDNLLDQDYSQVHGYETGGRRIFLSLEWQP